MAVDPVATRRFIESLSTHLEDHLAAWKSSLVDARREVETVLTAMGERIPAQARPLFPEDLVAMMLEDVIPPPAPPERIVETVVERVVETVVVPGAAAPPDWSLVRGSLAAIESARTQVDLLTRFLFQANSHASRVALLVLRNDRLTGWKAIGYDASGGRDDAAKTIDIATDVDPFAAETLKRERSMSAEPPDESWPLRRALGGHAPVRTVMVPMVIRDRIAGILVADELEGERGRLNEAALEVLAFTTGLAVDLLAARKKIPSPTLTTTGEAIPSFRGAPVDDGATLRAPAISFPDQTPTPMPRVQVEPPPPPMPPPPADFAPAAPAPRTEGHDGDHAKKRVTDAGEAIRALEESASYKRGPHSAPPMPAPRPAAGRASFEGLGLGELSAPAPRPAPPPRPVPTPVTPVPTGEVTLAFEHLKTPLIPIEPEPEARPVVAPREVQVPPRESSAPKSIPTPAAPMQEAVAGGAATPMAPPSGFVPRSRLGRGDEQQRAVDDAKRLARLLVSEIKLYNERKVEEGRSNGDLYERLRDDIQRSRQVYDERTPEAIRTGTDFFRDELVRILGEGRPEALGPMV